ncbi:MAG: LexA family transcriptional regulator [Synergistaceae bacterium]|nr:LexA family transcriptional regulator [Synergistaceae bacterium]
MRAGHEIRQLRRNLRLSQEGLANLIGVSRSAVYDWERNAYFPEGENLVHLAKALGVSVAYLIGETDDPTPADHTAGKERPLIKSNVHFEIEEPIPTDQIIVPVLSPEQAACLGKGKLLLEITGENEEKILFPKNDVGTLCEGKMPFAIIIDGSGMERWGIRDGSRVVINPAEEAEDFDIALVCFKGKAALKKLQRMRDGSISLISSDGNIITVPAEDTREQELFAIWGKAMTYTYKESGKIKHGL